MNEQEAREEHGELIRRTRNRLQISEGEASDDQVYRCAKDTLAWALDRLDIRAKKLGSEIKDQAKRSCWRIKGQKHGR